MKKFVYFIPAIVTVVLGIIGWFMFPDVMTVQIGFDGEVFNTKTKLFALLLPVAISFIGCTMSLEDSKYKKKGLTLSIIGVVVMIFNFVFNL